jgi:hypothetical protein
MIKRRTRRPGRSFVPRIELLEDRCTPATFGVPWPDARHLTLSFAPDGTAIAGHPSNLFDTLNAQMAPSFWQREILRAFQTWAVQANLSVGVVPDGGQPFGTPGPSQHDDRFGDIRLGAQGMAADALSVSVPHDPFLSGTWAGDVFFNSAAPLTAANLFPIALHEAAHALGLDHSPDPASPRFSHLNDRTTLTPGDVTAIQRLYGTRQPDANEGLAGNDRMATATRLRFSQDSDGFDGSAPVVAFGDITTNSDVDFFWLRPLDGYTGPMTFRLQTSGISLLAPRLTVFDARGRMLGQSLSTSPLGDTVTVRLNQVDPGATYYARVDGAVDDVFGVGRYGLAVTFDTRLTTPEAALDAVLRGPYDALRQQDVGRIFTNPEGTLFNDDAHADDDFAAATVLQTPPGYAANTHFETVASLSDAADVDFYRVRSANFPGGRPDVVTVTLTPVGVNGVTPRVLIFDRDLNPVPSQVLLNGNGTYTIQAIGLRPDTNYYLRVFAADGTAPVGNYRMEVNFDQTAAELVTLATGSLGAAQAQQSYALYVARSQLFQFRLSAGTPGVPAGGAVRLTILDAGGAELFTLLAPAGEVITGDARFFAPGTYTVRFSVEGAEPSGLSYSIAVFSLDSPIGPTVVDPTLAPQFPDPDDPTLFLYPGGILSPQPFFLALLIDLPPDPPPDAPPDVPPPAPPPPPPDPDGLFGGLVP